MFRNLLLALSLIAAFNMNAQAQEQSLTVRLFTNVGNAAGKLAANGKAIVDIADVFSREECEKVVKVFEGHTKWEAKLVLAEQKMPVCVQKTTKFTRGTITVVVETECRAVIGVTMKDLLANAFYNPQTRTVEVYLPQLQVIAVEPGLPSFDAVLTGLTGKSWDRNEINDLGVQIFKSTDFAAHCRKSMNPNSETSRKAAAHTARQALVDILKTAMPDKDVKVEVKLY